MKKKKKEKGITEDEMAGWYHWFDGCEFEWTQGVGDGHGGLLCCDSWGRKEWDTTERLNWTEHILSSLTAAAALQLGVFWFRNIAGVSI